MCLKTFSQKARVNFYTLFAVFVLVFSAIFFLFMGSLRQIDFLSNQAVYSSIESACGCAQELATITQNPWIYGFFAGLSLISFLFICYTLFTAYKIIRKTRLFISALLQKNKQPSPILLGLADTLNLNDSIIQIDYEDPIVFTFGFLQKKICISTGIIDTLTIEELRAVLEHEQAHLKSSDPFKKLIALIIKKALFFIPGIPVLVRQYETFSELNADAYATNCHTSNRHLAQALYKILGLHIQDKETRELAISLFSLHSTTDERVHSLVDKNHQIRYTVFIPSVLLTLFIILSGLVSMSYALPTTAAKALSPAVAHCISKTAPTNGECREVQQQVCSQNASTIYTPLCILD